MWKNGLKSNTSEGKLKRSSVMMFGPLPPIKGGISQYNHQLAISLSELTNLQVYTPSRLYPPLIYPGGKEEELETETSDWSEYPFTRASDLRLILKMMFGPRKDLAVVHWWTSARFFPTFLASLALRLRRIRICFICHNVLPHNSGVIARLLSSIILRSGSLHIVQSEKELETLQRIAPKSEPVVSPHPVWNKLKSTEPGNDSENILLLFGYVRKYKGIDTLLKALDKISTQLEFRVLVVGEVWNSTVAEQLEMRSNKDPRFEARLWYASQEEMQEVFNSATAVLLPYTEATGSGVLANAQQFGKPVIASRIEPFNHSVREGKDGILFQAGSSDELQEAIVKFLEIKDSLANAWTGSNVQVNTWQKLAKTLQDMALTSMESR